MPTSAVSIAGSCRPSRGGKVLADGIGIQSDEAADLDYPIRRCPNLFSPKRHAHCQFVLRLLQCEKFHANPLSTAEYR
jgi:hypothetical protein